eukprot:gene3986-4954_t
MGMEERILAPLRTMYNRLRRRFRVAGGLGEEFQATNGILQGCPLSVVALNALVAVWAKAVADRVPGVQACAYADDTYALSDKWEDVPKAHGVTEEFVQLTGQVPHPKKSKTFSTEKQRGRGIRIGGEQVPWVQEMTSLGAAVRLRKGPASRTGALEERTMRAGRVARAVGRQKLYFEARAHIAAAGAVASGTWGCSVHEFERCPEIIFALLAPGHRADPQQAPVFARIMTLHRMLVLRPDIRERVRNVWELQPDSKVAGPIGRVQNAIVELWWTWPQAELMETAEGAELDLSKAQGGQLAHEVRDALRAAQWRLAAERRPKDMGGLQRGLDRDACMELLRKGRQRGRKVSCE